MQTLHFPLLARALFVVQARARVICAALPAFAVGNVDAQEAVANARFAVMKRRIASIKLTQSKHCNIAMLVVKTITHVHLDEQLAKSKKQES